MKRAFLILIFFCFSILQVAAKKGMWIPTLLNKYNIEEMQQMGFKLSAEDVYSINNASLKDAVVLFAGGCTGEVISPEGLMITNHHCGYEAIQSHSSINNDYLTDGFWAMSREEELSNENLKVRFLIRMEDVTEQIFKGTTDDMDKEVKKDLIHQNIKAVEEQSVEGTHYISTVKPLFYGNQYFVYIYEEFKDVRLVGAPPSAIGKFGGDTDNWMWPRHTGDFAIFRIYADKDNKPAPYSPDNVPYTPRKYFPISMKGVEEGDFTMIFGYPGTTQQYLPSQAVELIMKQSNPEKIAIRTAKLNILSKEMEADRKVRIQYASKYARTSNAWKKWQGEIKGLKRLKAIEVKQEEEKAFTEWVNANNSRKEKYSHILDNFEKLYKEYSKYLSANDYYTEIVGRGTDIFTLASRMRSLSNIDNLKKYIKNYFKDYSQAVDEKVCESLLGKYLTELSADFLPAGSSQIMKDINSGKFVQKYYRKSILTDENKLYQLLDNFSDKQLKKLDKDPMLSLYVSLQDHFTATVSANTRKLRERISENQKLYMKAILEMNSEKMIMADANLTLRVGYGKVEGYFPRDGVRYIHYTTLEGIMEKDNPNIYDYDVPEKLRKLFYNKDYGIYKNADGTMPVCFTASNHTTGGNSGSPIINAEGALIGVNFDRCWEGTMSDIMFDPERCRNIMIDIRYALFIIDKFAGAGYLLDEMELIMQ